jgi:hypothetical protein
MPEPQYKTTRGFSINPERHPALGCSDLLGIVVVTFINLWRGDTF